MIATPNIPQISGLSFEAQDKILDNSKLLYGFVLNEDGPVTSTHRVAQFKDPASQTLLYSPEETSGEIEVFSTQSKPDLAYIRKGWSERAAMSRQSATLVTPGEHRIPTMDKMDAHALHLFGRFQVPCATFHIEPEDLMPSESFRRAVAAALLQPNETAKFHELQNTLSKFGHVLATRLEMGLSLCTTRKIPFKSIEDQILQEGEMKVQFLELLHSAVKNPSASTEKINVYTRGGNPGVLPGLDIISWLSTVQDPTNWMVIGVSSVVPTISILDEPLRSSVQALIASAHSMQLLQPPPIFHLPHRFTQRCAGAEPVGLMEAPLDIRLSKSFTISAWVRRGDRRSDQFCYLLSIESPQVPFSLLWLGNFPNVQPLTVLLAHNLDKHARVELKGQTGIVFDARTWMHVAVVQRWGVWGTDNEWLFFINGRKEASRPITAPMVHFDGARIVFGSGTWDNVRGGPWDGQIENVKVYQQALSEVDIFYEASERNAPSDIGTFRNDQGKLTAY